MKPASGRSNGSRRVARRVYHRAYRRRALSVTPRLGRESHGTPYMKRPPFLFRYRPPDEVKYGYLEGLLRENHIWASPPRGFTDSNDCTAQIDFEAPRREWLRQFNQDFRKLRLRGKARSQAVREAIATDVWKDASKHAEMAQGIQDTLNNSGVICLTDTALDDRMWNEYAGGHRGICLCFESSEKLFSETFDVNYVSELPRVKFNADSGEKVKAFLLTKGSSYSWEREWRYVDFDKGGGYKSIPPSALRAIVFGNQTEAEMRQEVLRLVTRWKPDVVLFTVDATESNGLNLRLQPPDGSQVSTMARIIPPIQVRSTGEPVSGNHAARLLALLGSVSPEHRRRDLDSRIQCLVDRLKFVRSSHGRRSNEAAAGARAAMREATSLLRELVDQSGAAIPGYGDVTLLLYRFLYDFAVKPGPGVLELILKPSSTPETSPIAP